MCVFEEAKRTFFGIHINSSDADVHCKKMSMYNKNLAVYQYFGSSYGHLRLKC